MNRFSVMKWMACAALFVSVGCLPTVKLPALTLESGIQEGLASRDRHAKAPGEPATIGKDGVTSASSVSTSGGTRPESANGSATPQVVLQDPNAIISSDLPGLVGRIITPDPGLVGNNSAGLIEPGEPAFFKLAGGYYSVQAVTERPVFGAKVSLLGPAGEVLVKNAATTDAQGRYRIDSLPVSGGSFFLAAEFQVSGKTFRFKGYSPGGRGGDAQLDVGAASTLVAAKIAVSQKNRPVSPSETDGDRYRKLVSVVSDFLTPPLIPYMAEDSEDIVPTFEQLARDQPAIEQAARALSPELLAPAAPWRVQTLIDASQLESLAIVRRNQGWLGGNFAVDASGAIYIPAYKATGPWPAPYNGLYQVNSVVYRLHPDSRGGYQGEAWAYLPMFTFRTEDELARLRPSEITFSPQGTLLAAMVRDVPAGVTLWTVTENLTRMVASFSVDAKASDFLLGRLVVDARGTYYLPAPQQHVIYRIPADQPTAEVYAGKLNLPGLKDGSGSGALFNYPQGLALGKDGDLFVADTQNGAIRRVAPGGVVSLHAGLNDGIKPRNGRGSHARFGKPEWLAIDNQGNTFVADSVSRQVRRISRDGSVFLVAGTGESSLQDGPGPSATFQDPQFLTLDQRGNLYVRDGNTIRKISPPPDQSP